MVFTNNIRKLVASLSERKHRKKLGLFKAEGCKCVSDTFKHFDLFYLLTTAEWIDAHEYVAKAAGEKLIIVQRRDILSMSSLTTPQEVIAVYRIPEEDFDIKSLSGSLILALDGVQDPGNLGTIMRTADWFGVTDIICSRSTADVYSPKVVQATMGAISRVRVLYVDLPSVIRSLACELPVYGTFLNGESIYDAPLSSSGVIVMGNEGNGVSPEVASAVTDRLLIPSFAEGETSESLNVAIATAITLSEFRRRQ